MPETNKVRCVVDGCGNPVAPDISICARCFSNVPGHIQRNLCISAVGEAVSAEAVQKAREYASAALGVGYVGDDGIGPQSETEVVP